MLNLKKSLKTATALMLSGMIMLSSGNAFAVPMSAVETGFAKNVILLIPDGMSHDGVTLTRWVYNDGEALHMDEWASGLMMTHNSDTAIADSAPAGTAMATGYKTQDKLIGVKPSSAILEGARSVTSDEALSPTASILEAAKLAGKSVGVIATSEIQHATPADFTAHAIHRNMYTTIGEQQVYQNMDVVLGGGAAYLLPDTTGSTDPLNKTRIDGENMQDAIQSLGYTYVADKQSMLNVTSGKLWGAFLPKALNKELVKSEEQPTLAEMTDKAIELLSKNNKGFFLMVEGSQVDWAAHGNQTIGLISEIKAFDDAVGVAIKFAKSNPNTLVIVASDHGNGGITIGDRSTTTSYPTHPIEYFTATLKKAKITEEAAATLVNTDRTNLAEIMSMVGIDDLTADELNALKSAESLLTEITNIVNTRAHIGWTTGGHTGEDVVLYVYASDYKNQLTGTIQNSDIALYAAKAMGIDLDAASDALFISDTALKAMGYDVSINSAVPSSAKMTLSKNGKTVIFDENKNLFVSNGQTVTYNGINVYNNKNFFVPQAAIDLIQASKTYTVVSGDVLWKIAKDHGTTIKELVSLNTLLNPNQLKVGQVLIMP